MKNLINFFKENLVGAIVGGIIGFMNIGADLVLTKVPCPYVDYFVEKCDCGFNCFAQVPLRYSILSIIILVVAGAFIQSMFRRK